MKRVLGLSGIKGLEHYKSASGSSSGALNAKNMLPVSSFSPSDSVSSGSFTNLKLAAEKLVKEQASAKRDLEMANSKLKKLMEQIHILEEKLQNAFNENAKLKAKQMEDEKIWHGLESKFSSAKTLCDNLTETLHQLAVQVQNAEKDKSFFEEKLSAVSFALDKLHEDTRLMSLRLDTSEETIKIREKELMELGLAKERTEMFLKDEQKRAASLIKDKDGAIEHLEESVAANKLAMEGLTSKMEELCLGLRVKEDALLDMRNSKETLEKEKTDLISSKLCLDDRLEMALKEIKNLEDFVSMLIVKFTELENQSLALSENVIQLNTLFDSCLKLAQQEKDLYAQCAQRKLDRMQHQCISVTSERNSLQLLSQELDDKVLELRKEQEFVMVQHADECRLAEEKIRKLESDAETLLSKQNEMQALISMMEDSAKTSLENSRSSDEKMQNLLMKLSELESESKGLTDGLNEDIRKKQDQNDCLQKEIEKREDSIGSLEQRIIELESAIQEKDRLVLELKTRENEFEDQRTEILKSMADKESLLEEAKKQYNQMLENKQLELSKHLKEISQRNDQAINDIRKKYEAEKQESVALEKEKADKIIRDLEIQYEKNISEYKEESKQLLVGIQEEHGSMIIRIQKEHDQKEMILISKHNEEKKRIELQAENELREKLTSLGSEHEAQLRALRSEHEEECRRLQEELDIQKAKEERQRALLQLQWKVMGDNPQEDQEVNSKKHYSISSTKRNSDGDRKTQHAFEKTEAGEKDSPYFKAADTPVTTLLRKEIPKRSRKVTHHEYEIETANGRTITKRKKTRSTVMFEDPRKQRRRETPKAKTPKQVVQAVKSRASQNPSNIGDLFCEGSLNPYTDDPYAFD